MTKRAWFWDRSSRRGTRQEQGYGAEWDKLRLVVLKRDQYLCQCSDCKASGRVRLASEVDHILSKALGGNDDLENLQAINRECHVLKTMLEKGYRPKPQIGRDGWPVA